MTHKMERALPRVGELNQPQVTRVPLSRYRGRARQQLAYFLTRLCCDRVFAGGLSREERRRATATDLQGPKCAS
jgi:hypothetical protein